MKKNLVFAALIGCTLTLPACNGWPHAPELKQVTNKPEKYQTYAPSAAQGTQVFQFDNRKFMVQPATVDLHDAKLQQVGNAGGMAIYAPEGAQPPYTNLYAPAGGTKWHPVAPVE